MIQRVRSYRRFAALLALGYIVAAALVGVAHRGPHAMGAPGPDRAALAVVDFLPAGETPVICGVFQEHGSETSHGYVCDACRIVDAPGLIVADIGPGGAAMADFAAPPTVARAHIPAPIGAPPLGSRAPPFLAA